MKHAKENYSQYTLIKKSYELALEKASLSEDKIDELLEEFETFFRPFKKLVARQLSENVNNLMVETDDHYLNNYYVQEIYELAKLLRDAI